MFCRRQSIQALTTLALILIVLIGSTGTAPRLSARTIVNIVVWQPFASGHEKKGFDKLVTEFNSTHPTIHVSELPVLDQTKIVASIAGGHPPDVLDFGSTANLGQMARQGQLQPLDNLIKASHMDVSAFIPTSWRPITFYGRRWGVPFIMFDLGLLYNRTAFQQAGIAHPPRTLEELDRDAAKLTVIKNGHIVRMGFIPNYPGSLLEVYAWLFGGDWFKGNKSVAATPANVQALQWETSYYKKYGASNVTRFMGGFGADLTAQDGFESGKVAMMFDGGWNVAFLKENVPSFHAGAVPFPAPAAHPKLTGTTYLDSNTFTLPTGSPHPKEAFEFIRWLTTNPQTSSEFASLTENLPQLKRVPQTAVLQDPTFQVFIQEANSLNARPLPQNPISAQFANNLGNAESAALLGKQTPHQALLGLQTTTQQELDTAQ